MNSTGLFFALFGAALGAGLAGAGSGMGVGIAGAAASGVLAEDPGKFGQTLLLQALPGTQGIYGLLFAFLVLIKVNMFGGGVDLTTAQGLMIGACGLPIGIAGYFSGVGQGRASAGAMGIIAKRSEDLGKAMIYPAMVETYAVLGLLLSILMLNSIQL
ncbi:MAG: V-type ATP synthase subunit K [Firmicutes bacterium]|jgi:V/A-type H+-transporting ATPase subunit K|nr:V-type ATP synthase subunit K [Bacillota bacterium]